MSENNNLDNQSVDTVSSLKLVDESIDAEKSVDNKNLLFNKLEGKWFHEQDGNSAIKINKQKWIDLYYSNSMTESDSFDINIISELPEKYKTTVQSDFIMLFNKIDTTYFELLGVNDSSISLMHYPSGKKHLYKRTIYPHLREVINVLKNKNIDIYFKEIYYKEHLIEEDNNKMLSITDSLFTNNTKTDLFYFIVFTKSMNGSDGFYSEAVGMSAMSFIKEKTEYFADYFNIAPKLTEKDMDNWAGYIYGEIQISREDEEEKAINELENELLENIKGARKEYKPVIEELIEKIRKAHNNG